MKKRMLSLFMALCMVLSLFTVPVFAAADGFTDMPDESSWAYKALSAAVENGLLKGSGGSLRPFATLTRAEMAAVINNAFGASDKADISGFTDVPADKWYAGEIAKAVRMGSFAGSGSSMRPEDPVTREEAFVVLTKLLKLEDGTAADLSAFADAAQVSSWAAGKLAALVKAGYVSGSNGKLNPKKTITRAEFAQVMYNTVASYISASGTYTEVAEGNLMVNAPGVTLKDATVTGDLIVGEGVGDGEFTLDGTTVTGRLIVRGGGEHSIIIKNKSTVGSILVGKTGDGGVRVRTEEGCRVEVITIDDGKDDIILEGEFNQVAVATDAPVVLKDADVTGLTVKAENASVKLDGETKVVAVKISETAASTVVEVAKTAAVTQMTSSAESVKVSGEGTVKSAEISGNNTEINTKGTSLTVSEGTEGVKQNDNQVKAGETVTTSETGSGSSGGGSGSGSSGGGGHTHSWGSGTVTTEATCTTAGVRTYTCSCGETKTEVIDALGHDWDEGAVTTPATENTDGVMTFTCRRTGCGETRTEVIAKTPFSIEADEELGILETMYFATFAEALAESEKYTDETPCIVIRGYVEFTDVTFPAGHDFRAVGATLALNNCIFAGESGTLSAAAMYMQSDSKLFINGTQITGDGGAILYNSVVGEHIELAVMQGESGESLPGFGLIGVMSNDTHPFSVKKDIDLSVYFCGVRIGDYAEVTVEEGACLKPGYFSSGEEGYLRVENGSVDFGNGMILGTTEDCTVRMLKNSTHPGDIVMSNGLYGKHVTMIGDDVEMNGQFSSGDVGITIRKYYGEAPDCTLTVKSGSDITLGQLYLGDDLIIEKGAILTLDEDIQIEDFCTITNNGTLNINAEVNFCGELNNNGTLNLNVVPNGDGDYRHGQLNLEGANAALNNSGTINITGRNIGDDQYRYGELIIRGAAFNNKEAGIIKNDGDFYVYLLPTVYVKKGTDDAEKQSDASLPVFQNGGTIHNKDRGCFGVDCNSAVNSGTIRNDGFMNLGNYLTGELTYERERCAYVAPSSEEGWTEFWDSFGDWDEEDGYYWKNVRVTAANVRVLDGKLTNNGTIINNDNCNMNALCLTNNGVFTNEGYVGQSGMDLTETAYWDNAEESLAGVSVPEAQFINNGTLNNGSVTAMGEQNNGSDANYNFTDGSFENNGSVTNNGYMLWENVDYTQAAAAKLETYNAGGFEIYGGSLTVPHKAEFKNEGYMKIIDRYGEEYEPCDLDGFVDFFTTWNQDGNDSHWCEFTAEVYDLDGYNAAVAEQNSRSENMKYNRLDFRDDITFKEDVVFDDFGTYWLNEKPSDDGKYTVGMTMTVEEGVTLTIAAGNMLMLDGVEGMTVYFSPNKLVIDGTLVIAPEIQEEWEDDVKVREYVSCGEVQIWTNGFFDASKGTVTNNGIFEVRYLESYDVKDGDGHFRVVYNGESFFRPDPCTVTGEPENTIYTAEVRSEAGLKTAIGNTAPVFGRILIREDCTVTVNEEITIPSSIKNIRMEAGSGLVVNDKAELTLNCRAFDNNGDVSVYGTMVIGQNCEFRNHQNLEVGSVSGPTGTVNVHGQLKNWGYLHIYSKGIVNLEESGSIEYDLTNEDNFWCDTGGMLTGVICNTNFTESVTIGINDAFREGSDAYWKCVFEEPVTVLYTGQEYSVNFFNSCTFKKGITVEAADSYAPYTLWPLGGDTDKRNSNRPQIYGVNGATVTVSAPVQVSGSGTDSFTVNGVTVSGTNKDSKDSFACWIRYEDQSGCEEKYVFQIDSCSKDNTTVLTGTLSEDWDELRLQQGRIDISGLTIESAEVRIGDEFRTTEVNVGDHGVNIYDSPDARAYGYTITASSAAIIWVDSYIVLTEEDYECTPLTVCYTTDAGITCEYFLQTHLFGDDDCPSVFISTNDPAVEYTLEYGDIELSYNKEINPEKNKTHLNCTDPANWFTKQDNVQLTVTLPDGPTFIFTQIPVKPEKAE